MLAATGVASAAAGLAAGWLPAAWIIRRLRSLLTQALWVCGHDPLTGLPNRTRAEQLFTRHAEAGDPTAIALLDLDRFKAVNDTYGHHAGDQLLIAVAARLTQAAHRHRGHAARLSGDEFVLLLPAHPGNVSHPVTAILHEISQPVTITTEDVVRLTPTATAGTTWFDGVHGNWSSLLRQADLALYHARAHRVAHEPYQPGMHMPDQPHRHGPRLRDQRPEAAA
jgi:diguanylate cyclase (GGDEF)-like protein